MLFVDLFIQNEDKWVTVGSSGGKETVREYSDYVKNGKKYIYPASVKDSYV